jgi:UPF0755 protein
VATRLLVILFALVVIGAGALIGSFVLTGESGLGSTITAMADPLAAVDPEDASRQTVTVRSGASAADIGADLQERGLVRSSLAFRLAAEQSGVGGSLAAGDYDLSRSMTTNEILQVLARGQVKRGLVATIPEGWRIEQIADRLESTGFSSRDEFLRAAATPATVPNFELLSLARPPTLEGYLFPETYEVPQPVSGSRAAELMLQMFTTRLGPSLRAPSESGLTAHQILTLASIVEREARVPAERATIASVFLNRLEADLPLQADPTVQYALASRDGPRASAYNYWKTDLSPDELRLESPFNTYVHKGLPPSPICNPSEASVRAVLEPAQTDYLYFVATTDNSGTHLFARTLDEHNANVAKVNARR